QARDVTVLYVSRAPLEKLQAYKKRMGWTFQWASSAESDFNFDFGASHSEEEVRGRLGPMLERGAPPAVSQLVDATGSHLIGYLSETPAFTAFTLEGWEVVLAEGGERWLYEARTEVPDVIVHDIGLPDVDGLEVCRSLRASGNRTPILMLTAQVEVPDRVAGLDAGADDYLVKPYDVTELQVRL